MMRRLFAFVGLLVSACGGGGPDSLAGVQRSIDQRFGDVPQLPLKAFDALAPDDRLVFDVRSREEFAVSHLPGAIWVDPDSSADAFLDAYAQALGGRTAVFYCSVGWRSSALAERVREPLSARGVPVANLEGGAFGWRNAGRLLERDGMPTGDIHPYDRRWGRLIEEPAARVAAP